MCALCQLQMALLSWDKGAADAAAKAAAAQLAQAQAAAQAEPSGLQLQLQLVLKILQVVMDLQAGRFQDLGRGATKDSPPTVLTALEGILQRLGQHSSQQQEQQPGGGHTSAVLLQGWLPLPVASALVQLLAAVILKPLGKNTKALEHISTGLQALSAHTSVLLQDRAAQAGTASGRHGVKQQLRTCLALRVLLLEARLQLSILSSDFAAARAAAAESIALSAQFPALLQDARPMVHLQAGLYAQAVGSIDAALAHFNKMAALAGQCNADHLAVDGCCLAAMCCLAQGSPNARESVEWGASLHARPRQGHTRTALPSTLPARRPPNYCHTQSARRASTLGASLSRATPTWATPSAAWPTLPAACCRSSDQTSRARSAAT
jgi:hypothetical protein